MSDQFTLSGSYNVTPLGGAASLDPNIDSPLNEALVLQSKQYEAVHLGVDTPVPVAFGTVVNAHVVILKAQGGKVKAVLTSADGSAQIVPFDSVLILISQAAPITAISLTRVAATDTIVRVFLGEKA
jgi:hypothetical protein